MENTIALRLKAFRISTGLTQADFGEACGISQRTYANLEGGRTKKVSGSYLAQIEAAYEQVNPTWLRHGAGEMLRRGIGSFAAPAPEVAQPAVTPVPRMRIDRNLEGMSDAQRADYWRRLFEQAQEKLDARDHEDARRLAVGKFNASSSAASPTTPAPAHYSMATGQRVGEQVAVAA